MYDWQKRPHHYCQEGKPDLILLDLTILPGLMAIKFVAYPEKKLQTANIFIMMLTGKRKLEEIVLGLKYADDYILKPFSNRKS